MVTGGGGGDSGREGAGWGLGKVEEVLGKVLAQGIEIWWPEEGDRRKSTMAERADERSSSLVDGMRRKEDMTTGVHNQINIWVLSGRTVVAKMASHAIFQYNVLAIDDIHNT